MRVLRIGLIGTGFMGKTHLFSIRSLPFYYGASSQPLSFQAEVTAVAASTLESARRFADTYNIPRIVASAEELINDPDIDIIDICTPNSCHYAVAKSALENGKHVLCEKPLAITLEEADELAALSLKTGLTAGMVFNNRHLASVLRAKELIDEGRLGRILSFDFAYRHNSCIDPDRLAGWKQDALFGGGTLADLGSHVIDLCQFLCGPIASVIGREQIAFPTHLAANGQVWNTNADEAFYLITTLRDGGIGTITASKLVQGANDELTFSIHGERGALRFSLMDPDYLDFYDATAKGGPLGGERGFTRIECVGRYPKPANGFPAIKAPQGWLRGHIGSMHAYLSAVADGQPASPSFEDGRAVQAVLAASYKSASSGQEVRLC